MVGDLRWILLIVGIVVVAAVYFSSRFEQEDWKREREAHKKPRKIPSFKPGKSTAVEPQVETPSLPQQSAEPAPPAQSCSK